ncbi:cytochrome B562 [Haemophilus paracuniculus]|uniref:Cytochrome B562 n=1 Tax=Haemophilus paracuniculus TaxID=734 RepID=A0A1T0AV30_9PAST|nr:cytochrome b562 [Haemophilus paracuniculus]OOS00321.1 cytochrome B562 [Haemophilus paracuniculus]
MKLKHLFSVGLLAVSAVAVANGVMMEMFQMKRQLNELTQAESVEAFRASAKNFIEVSEKAQATMPASLDGDQSRFVGYQKGMQEVIDVVKQADSLAEQGKLDEAKALTEKLNDLRKQYHKEYK